MIHNNTYQYLWQKKNVKMTSLHDEHVSRDFPNNYARFLHTGGGSSIVTVPGDRGGLALLFWGGVMALKEPVERGQALNRCSHLEIV